MNMDRFHKSSHKAFGVLLAFSIVGTVMGLHRLWMRQKWWWIHPLVFVAYVVAGTQFLALNADFARQYMAKTHGFLHLGDYSHLWLLLFGFGWIAFIFYDCIMVWTWPVLEQPSPEEEGAP